MKHTVFADTAAWLALINKSDTLHAKAGKIRKSLLHDNTRLIVTDYVIVEIANALSRVPFRAVAVRLIDSIKTSRDIEIIDVDKEVYDRAWSLYSQRVDKEWSFTDCASFVVMNSKKITEAFTSDRHFEQAGFKILLGELNN